jgi:uncharacterized protein (DUF58 family)
MTIHDILATVRRVEIQTRRLATDTMVGAYLSQFKGRGLDFEELRDYVPGDDVRDIDWNVTRRMGRPFVKRYREERELGVVLAVDISASSEFGSVRRSKREFAAEVAATLAFSAARNSDKVALLLFTDRVELYVPPRKGRKHLLQLIREMLFFEPTGTRTRIPAALAALNHLLHRRSIIFLLTDFLHCFDETSLVPIGGERQGERVFDRTPSRNAVQDIGFTNARHDLVCIHLLDPREKELPRAGLLTLEDPETGELLEVDSLPAAARETYLRHNTNRIVDLDRALRQAGVHTLRLSADEPFARTLQVFFETRHRR